MNYYTLLFVLLSFSSLYGQDSLYLNLIAEINRGDTRYSGSWAYTDTLGREYGLVGAKSGTAIYWLDNPEGADQELAFIPGPSTNWREITVVHQHAYVVTDVQDDGHHLQVIDLSNLPDTANLLTTFDSTFTKGHIIQKDIFDESPYIYVNGTTSTEGVHILDISDPTTPVEVGLYAPGYYIHDCHVRGDLLFASAFFEPGTDVVDISDKSNPTFLYRIPDPNGFTHSSSMTLDGKYLMVANENDGLEAIIWNIEDPNNLEQVARYTANPESLVHNPYIKGDFAFISHNTEGLRVVDLVDPEVPVEVAFYDTYPGPSGGFNGLWSACPYLPSGKIVGGDRTRGLLVWEWEQHFAGRIYVQVRAADSGNPIFNASMQIEGESDTLRTDANGWARWGQLEDSFAANIQADGFLDYYFDFELTEGQNDTLVIYLDRPLANSAVAKSDTFEMYPNPATDVLQLRVSVAGVLRIHQLDGKLCHQQPLAEGQTAVSIEHLPKGKYQVEFQQQKSGKISSQLLIIQ
ncbi:MAG: choice-of-anchor B family protein [Saprospiraceae bacterium]|nr:choice-of-anchor B family protein [Saprospiraceae bacterium]